MLFVNSEHFVDKHLEIEHLLKITKNQMPLKRSTFIQKRYEQIFELNHLIWNYIDDLDLYVDLVTELNILKWKTTYNLEKHWSANIDRTALSFSSIKSGKWENVASKKLMVGMRYYEDQIVINP